MAALTAPYNTSMHLGDGFNSYTQQLCIDHAVTNEAPSPAITAITWSAVETVPQAVTYKTQVIDKVTDVYDSLKINGAFDIKFGAATINGSGEFINSNAIKDSDVSFMVTVKVVNQIYQDQTLTKFNAIPDLDAAKFTRVFGDSFISGFVEGGEFTAIISIKAKDRRQANKTTADAKIQFTSEKLTANMNAGINKDGHDFLNENETTISVMYTGGGQQLKSPEEDWTFETMREAALKFPMLVAHTPIRTHAILTRYDALRTFHTDPLTCKLRLPAYERATVYTSVLQDAFVDYKTISRTLQILAYDVTCSVQSLKPSPQATRPVAGPTVGDPVEVVSDNVKDSVVGKEISLETDDATGNAAIGMNGIFTDNDTDNAPKPSQAAQTTRATGSNTVKGALASLIIEEPYAPTIEGIEEARVHCRHMMNRIVAEVDAVTARPEIAVDETRLLPYMSSFLFKQLLPIGVLVPPVVAIEAGQNPTLVSGMMKDLANNTSA